MRERVDVVARAHPVARDLGVDDARDAPAGDGAHQLVARDRALGQPAARRDASPRASMPATMRSPQRSAIARASSGCSTSSVPMTTAVRARRRSARRRRRRCESRRRSAPERRRRCRSRATPSGSRRCRTRRRDRRRAARALPARRTRARARPDRRRSASRATDRRAPAAPRGRRADRSRDRGSARRSAKRDAQEVVEQQAAGGAALLGMELRRHDVVARDDRGKALAVVARRDRRVGLRDPVRVQKVRPRAGGDAVDERMCALDQQVVPTHVRDAGRSGEAADFTG